MRKEDIFDEYFFEDEYEDIHKMRLKFKNRKIKNLPAFYDSLNGCYENIGFGEYFINKNIIELKKNFSLSAQMQCKFIELYDQGDKNAGEYGMFDSSIKTMSLAIISEDIIVAKELAELYGGRPEVENETYAFRYNFSYALKYLILEDEHKANEYVDKLMSVTDYKYHKDYRGFAVALKGIMTKNTYILNQGLEHMLKNTSKQDEYSGGMYDFLYIPGLAIAKLAKKIGVEISIKDERIPMDLVRFQDIDYPRFSLLEEGKNED